MKTCSAYFFSTTINHKDPHIIYLGSSRDTAREWRKNIANSRSFGKEDGKLCGPITKVSVPAPGELGIEKIDKRCPKGMVGGWFCAMTHSGRNGKVVIMCHSSYVEALKRKTYETNEMNEKCGRIVKRYIPGYKV